MRVVDKWWRHLLKTTTWRIIALVFLMVLSYILTGSMAIATSIAVADLLIKGTLYFLHEHAWSKLNIGRELKTIKGCVVWFTGLSGSGKSTVADRVAEKLRKKLHSVSRIDGDVARRTFSSDLGFSPEDRAENCRRATHAAAYASESSIILAAFISPYRHVRDYVREIMHKENVFIVQIVASIEACEGRDPKGMYAQLNNGRYKGNPFTGVHKDAPYESEENADLYLFTEEETVDESADKVIKMLKEHGYV